MRPASAFLVLIACGLASTAAFAADSEPGAPIGAWRASNRCFLAAFVLREGGRAEAAYLSGEEDNNAAWTWEAGTLKITSMVFTLDSFSARLADNHLQADYVWHDLDKDQLNKEPCVFERFALPGL